MNLNKRDTGILKEKIIKILLTKTNELPTFIIHTFIHLSKQDNYMQD